MKSMLIDVLLFDKHHENIWKQLAKIIICGFSLIMDSTMMFHRVVHSLTYTKNISKFLIAVCCYSSSKINLFHIIIIGTEKKVLTHTRRGNDCWQVSEKNSKIKFVQKKGLFIMHRNRSVSHIGVLQTVANWKGGAVITYIYSQIYHLNEVVSWNLSVILNRIRIIIQHAHTHLSALNVMY